MPVTGHAGVIARWIGADGSETDLEDRYLELFCLAKRFSRSKNSGFAFQKHGVWGGYLVYKPR